MEVYGLYEFLIPVLIMLIMSGLSFAILRKDIQTKICFLLALCVSIVEFKYVKSRLDKCEKISKKVEGLSNG